MGFINYNIARRVLVMTKGHPFHREDFFSLFDAMPDIDYAAIDQPVSQLMFDPAVAAGFDAFVLYDMPGMDFMSVDEQVGMAPRYVQPSEQFKANFLELLERGHGFVFLHHSLAAWPGWPEYAEIVGGKFLYRPDTIRGEAFPDSGYRHEVSHNIFVEAEHPVTEGVDSRFSITDEVYLGHAFEDVIVPLLSSDYEFSEENFYSAQLAVQGTLYSREDWAHPRGSKLIGWAKHYRNSPIVYLQCGDSKSAYENPNFQRLLSNAIDWVSSESAKTWASKRYAEEKAG